MILPPQERHLRSARYDARSDACDSDARLITLSLASIMTPTVLTFNLTALSRMEIDQHDALLLMAGLLLLLLVVAATPS